MEDDMYETFASTLQEKNSNLYDALKLEGLEKFVGKGDWTASPEREFMNYFMELDTVHSSFADAVVERIYD